MNSNTVNKNEGFFLEKLLRTDDLKKITSESTADYLVRTQKTLSDYEIKEVFNSTRLTWLPYHNRPAVFEPEAKLGLLEKAPECTEVICGFKMSSSQEKTPFANSSGYVEMFYQGIALIPKKKN